MEKLKVFEHNHVEVVDSREVARLVEKSHAHLMRDIYGYCKILGENNESNFGSVDFFIPSTYKDGKGETRPCYLLTKKGCDMVANKMTGEKGVLFTAAYVTAFEAMRESIQATTTTPTAELETRRVNLETAKLLNQIAGGYQGDYRQILQAYAVKELVGEFALPLPEIAERTYSAGEIGEMLGVSGNKIGRLANANEMKTEEFGKFFVDKSPHSNKEVETFRYFGRAIDKFKELLENE